MEGLGLGSESGRFVVFRFGYCLILCVSCVAVGQTESVGEPGKLTVSKGCLLDA